MSHDNIVRIAGSNESKMLEIRCSTADTIYIVSELRCAASSVIVSKTVRKILTVSLAVRRASSFCAAEGLSVNGKNV